MLKFVKSFLIICLMSIEMFSAAEEKKREIYDAENTLIVGTTADFMPFEFISNGKIIGFDIDLINAIAKELHMTVLIRDMQFYALIPSLENGDIQVAIAGMSYTTERARQINFSKPYYFNKFAMLVIGDHDKINPIKAGMKIGVQTGTVMEEWIQKQAIGAEIKSMDSNIKLIAALKDNHLDGVLFDNLSAKSVINSNPYIPLNLIALPGVDNSGMSIGVMKNSPLLEQINNAIDTLTANGEISKLKTKWGL
jgi:polar amino acid transport system substrate-binding protein